MGFVAGLQEVGAVGYVGVELLADDRPRQVDVFPGQLFLRCSHGVVRARLYHGRGGDSRFFAQNRLRLIWDVAVVSGFNLSRETAKRVRGTGVRGAPVE